jgi:predicted kinase
MAVLVLLNGVPASGKSTIAHAWAERHADALPVALDIDVVRAMIGGWQHEPNAAGHAARAMAVAAARAHLASGRDVVVPQYLRRPELIEELAALAAEVGADFVECVVHAEPDLADRRFHEREAEALAAAASSARSLPGRGPIVHGGLGGDRMADVVTELEVFLATRPGTVRVTPTGDLLDAVDQLDRVVAAARR